jgi:hypothetical protein
MIVPELYRGAVSPAAKEPSCSAWRGWSSYATASRLDIPQIDMARDECEAEKAICLGGHGVGRRSRLLSGTACNFLPAHSS